VRIDEGDGESVCALHSLPVVESAAYAGRSSVFVSPPRSRRRVSPKESPRKAIPGDLGPLKVVMGAKNVTMARPDWEDIVQREEDRAALFKATLMPELPADDDEHLKCGFCLRVFLHKDKFQHHKDTAHKSSGRVLCGICPKTFATLASCRQHLERYGPELPHHEVRVGGYPCKVLGCGVVSISSNASGVHTRSAHPVVGVTEFQCLYCKKFYRNKKGLQDHAKGCRKDPNIELKPCGYAAQGCKSTFCRMSDLNLHMVRVHGHSAKKELKAPK
jgi:hypothetical protein